MQDLGAHAGHFQHFLVGDLVDLAGCGADVGVRGIDAVHVGIDFAFTGAEHCGQGHCRRVRAAATQGCDAVVFGDALEAGHHEHIVGLEVLLEHIGIDFVDAGRTKGIVRAHGNLPAQQRAGLDAGILEQHGEQGNGDLLSCGNQHVAFCGIGSRRPFLGETKQLVGVAGTGRQYSHNLGALFKALANLAKNLLHALKIGYGCTAKLLNKNFH